MKNIVSKLLLLSGVDAIDTSGKTFTGTKSLTKLGSYSQMISELDDFTFAEMPEEFEAQLDQEESGSDDETLSEAPPANKTVPLHMPTIAPTHDHSQLEADKLQDKTFLEIVLDTTL